MGSPISGVLAEVVTQEFERIAFSNAPPKLWIRYVDDILAGLNKNDISTFFRE